MSSSTAQKPARATASKPLRRGSGSSSGNAAAHLTSQRIASDLAAFKKSGGRIEVLGNTPLRPYSSRSASSKSASAARRGTTATAATKASSKA